MRNLATTVAAAALALTLLFAPSAAAKVKILAPDSIHAGQSVRFGASAPQTTEKVVFYVDGNRRWVDSAPNWRFGHDGDIRLPAGRHVLSVRALQPNRIVTTRRTTYVDPLQSSQTDAPKSGSDSVAAGQQASPSAPVETAPSAAPEATPSSAPANEGLLFSGSQISDFAFNQSAPGAVTEVADPAGSGKKVLKFTVDNKDVAPITPTHDPRAQLVTPAFVHPGDETWWHTRFYLPADFPSNIPGWVTVLEGPYGPPWDGSPPVSISVDDGEIRFQRDDTYAWDIPWQEPIQRGKWIDVVFHSRFGHDGFVELWIDGKQVTFFENSPHNPLEEGPTQHLDMQTMDHTNDGGPNFFVIQNYRQANMFNSLTVYHGPTEVGTTRQSVEG